MRASGQVDGFYNLSETERVLLDLIWRHGPISRKALAELAGVTGASATRLTKRVLSLGLVEESVAHEGSVGNPIRPLKRNQSGLYSAGVSFAKDRIAFAIADMNGSILEVEHQAASGITLAALALFVREKIAHSAVLSASGARLVGLGMAVPGYRAKAHGEWAIHWDFPELLRVDLAAHLQSHLDVPVFAERDAIAGAWAERLSGKGRNRDDFCYLYLAQGVGGAIVSGGRPLGGAHGNAGGFGALFPYDEPRPSQSDFHRHLVANGFSLDAIDLSDSDCCMVVDQWIAAVVPGLRRALGLIARLYDPGLIVVGGAISREIIDRLISATQVHSIAADYTADLPIPGLSASDLSTDAILQGAAALPIARIVQLPSSQSLPF